jgi:acetylornithine deacetylase/succinyl-diaminopimelate desuccinylase-like protein
MRTDEAIDLLARLCRQPSVSAEGTGIEEMARLLAGTMESFGVRAQVLPTGGHPAVVGEVRGRSDRTLLFYNHYDVQPVDPLDRWLSPPFEPALRDGRLFARGATDNKGNIVSRLMAVRALRESEEGLPVTVRFLVEGEEEIGSPHLPDFVRRHRDLLAAEACVWEDTFRDDPERAVVTLGNKGLTYIEITCRTADVDFHSTYAPIYPNAAWRLMSALATLRDADGRVAVQGFYDRVRPPTAEDEELLDRLPPIDLAERRARFGLRHLPVADGREAKRRHLTEPTLNLSGFHSGYAGPGAKTVIPSEARAKLDVRLVPDQDPAEVFGLIRQHLERHGFGDLQVEGAWGGHPSKSPAGHLARVMDEAARAVYGRPAQIEPFGTGSTPNWVVDRLLGIPVAATGIGANGSNTHAPNENVEVAALAKGIDYLAEIIRRF